VNTWRHSLSSAALVLFIAWNAASPNAFAVDAPLRHAPAVAPVDINNLPAAECLASPEVRVLLGYTRRPLNLPDGRMAVFSFSYSAPANWIFIVDGKDLSYERHSVPNNDIASHTAALGQDCGIYLMPYAHSRAYRFDVGKKIFEQYSSPLPEGEYTWDALGGSNGRIYFGTWPNAMFGEYEPKTGQWRTWKNVVSNTAYVTEFVEDKLGRILFRAWGPDSVWMRFDPASAAFDRTEAPATTSYKTTEVQTGTEIDEDLTDGIVVGGREFAISNPSGRIWEIKDKKRVLAGETKSYAQPKWWLKQTDTGFFGVSYYGSTFRYDIATGETQRGQLDNLAKSGNAIMFVEKVTPECVIGANYSQQNLFRVNPRNGEVVSSDTMIARTTGEPMCAVGLNGKAYIGIYVHALLSVYDPAQPFGFMTNPRELRELNTEFKQTRPRAAVTDDKRVYFSVDGDYNELGGALAIIDPAANTVDVIPDPIRDQNLPSLVYDPKTKLLWGGTDRWGQMHSHAPTQPSAVLYAFNPETKAVVKTLTPWPGVDVVTVWAASPKGVVVASSGSEIALVDAKTHEILFQGTCAIGIPAQMRVGADGALYGLWSGMFYRWDISTNTLTALAKAVDCIYLTESEPNTWVVASAQSVFRIKLQ
jgi:hypothetical protein